MSNQFDRPQTLEERALQSLLSNPTKQVLISVVSEGEEYTHINARPVDVDGETKDFYLYKGKGLRLITDGVIEPTKAEHKVADFSGLPMTLQRSIIGKIEYRLKMKVQDFLAQRVSLTMRDWDSALLFEEEIDAMLLQELSFLENEWTLMFPMLINDLAFGVEGEDKVIRIEGTPKVRLYPDTVGFTVEIN